VGTKRGKKVFTRKKRRKEDTLEFRQGGKASQYISRACLNSGVKRKESTSGHGGGEKRGTSVRKKNLTRSDNGIQSARKNSWYAQRRKKEKKKPHSGTRLINQKERNLEKEKTWPLIYGNKQWSRKDGLWTSRRNVTALSGGLCQKKRKNRNTRQKNVIEKDGASSLVRRALNASRKGTSPAVEITSKGEESLPGKGEKLGPIISLGKESEKRRTLREWVWGGGGNPPPPSGEKKALWEVNGPRERAGGKSFSVKGKTF